MKVTINGKSVMLNRTEVQSAKKNASLILKKVEMLAQKYKLTTYYFTFLIVMHMMTQEVIDNMSPDNLAMIMNRLNSYKEKEARPHD